MGCMKGRLGDAMNGGVCLVSHKTDFPLCLVSETKDTLIFGGHRPKKGSIEDERMVPGVTDVYRLQGHAGVMIIRDDSLARLKHGNPLAMDARSIEQNRCSCRRNCFNDLI